MVTPTGQINMTDFHTHITRSSGQLSMSEMRTRYGGSGDIKFSDLQNTESYTITVGTHTEPATKFGDAFTRKGYSNFFYPCGSVSPNENTGAIQLVSDSFMTAMYTNDNSGTSAIEIRGAPDAFTPEPNTSYEAQDITRICTANTARSLSTGNEVIRFFAYNFPTTNGTTVLCLIKF